MKTYLIAHNRGASNFGLDLMRRRALFNCYRICLSRFLFFLSGLSGLFLMIGGFNMLGSDHCFRLMVRLGQKGNGVIGGDFDNMGRWMFLFDSSNLFFLLVSGLLLLQLRNVCIFKTLKSFAYFFLGYNLCFFFVLLSKSCFYFRLLRDGCFCLNFLRNSNDLQLFI